jgi:hypothetical protein
MLPFRLPLEKIRNCYLTFTFEPICKPVIANNTSYCQLQPFDTLIYY